MLRIYEEPTSEDVSNTGFFNVDKKRKQITLYEPSCCAASTDTPQDRKLAIMAPKMFAFDSIFSEEDTQTDVCGNALMEIIHTVIGGNDGCLFCFGYSKLGKSKTMIGSPDNISTLGVIPCAISWLFKGINEQKQKTGTRFSVRVSAIELTINSQQIRDLLAGHASDCEQSPGIYLRDDPLLGGNVLQNQSELRAATIEKAAFYLDSALANKSTDEESHFLYTMHLYQYNVAAKAASAVAGGRSRLHLIDLVGCDRTKSNCSINVSGIGNVLLTIFNGQRHLPHKEQKITQVLKECLGSLTCHAAMIAHVSRRAEHYCETLTTVQFASRIHRMRRKKIKFTGISSGVNTVEENARLTNSSDFEPSSSEQSADTVIYLGPSEETDGEHPPVFIPHLNSTDNRGAIGKVLKESDFEGRYHPSHLKRPAQFNSRSVPGSPQRSFDHRNNKNYSPSHYQNRLRHGKSPSSSSPTAGFSSAKSSPVRTVTKTNCSAKEKMPSLHGSGQYSEERWIDGPRIPKSKVAEGRNVHMLKKDGTGQLLNLGKREMWVDGPTTSSSRCSPYSSLNLPCSSSSSNNSYGFMDSYKKNMIKKWVESQYDQLQSYHHRTVTDKKHHHQQPYRELTTFKTCLDNESDNGRGIASGQEEEDEEKETVDFVSANEDAKESNETEQLEDSKSRSPDDIEGFNNKEYISDFERRGDGSENDDINNYNEEMELEFIEVEEPEEPVPMQDCCLQVTEEDIAFCMGKLENPLPEVDQEEHPLRVLSQENMTVVSTFTDSLSIANDLDQLFPSVRRQFYRPTSKIRNILSHFNNYTRPLKKGDIHFEQLSRLHKFYETKFSSDSISAKQLNDSEKSRSMSRWQSMMLSEIFSNIDNNNVSSTDFDSSSVASEPAYLNSEESVFGKFCENCRVNLTSIERINDSKNLWLHHKDSNELGSRLRSYKHIRNMLNLRHPDGSSNPNLCKEEVREPGNGAEKENRPTTDEELLQDDEECLPVPPPLPSKLLTINRDRFECGRLINSKVSSDNSVYSINDYNSINTTADKNVKITNGFKDLEISAHEYPKARVKKLETGWNPGRLMELKREQKQLLNELATAKQRLLHTNEKRSNPLDCCAEQRAGRLNRSPRLESPLSGNRLLKSSDSLSKNG